MPEWTQEDEDRAIEQEADGRWQDRDIRWWDENARAFRPWRDVISDRNES